MYVAVAHTEGIPDTLGTEDVQREKTFQKIAELCITEILEAPGIYIPLINCPGKRVKTKKQMKEIEEPAVENRAPQKVQHQRPTKQEKRKKSQVDEKIKNMMRKTKEGKAAKENNGKRKMTRPGKDERQKRAHHGSSGHESGHKVRNDRRNDRSNNRR